MKFIPASKSFLTIAALTALNFAAIPAHAYQIPKRWYQAQVVSDGRVTVEAANIWLLQCDNPNVNPNENGQQFYLYEYVDPNGNTRTDVPPYRVISPPNWGHAIGGHDYSDWKQAAAFACQGGNVNAPATSITGTWQLTSNCGFYGDINTNGSWKATLSLIQAADGSLTGTATNDKLNPTFSSPGDWGATIKSQYKPPTMTLVLHPSGWVSVLQLSGTLSGSQINGTVHHYTTDDCAFSMTPVR